MLFASRLRSIARDVEPALQISEMARFDQVASAGARTMTLLLWSFLALASVVVLLSLTGIYAVFSFSASQRTREVGIRVALGGKGRHVIAVLFRRPSMQTGLGIVIGLLIADACRKETCCASSRCMGASSSPFLFWRPVGRCAAR